MVIRKDLRPGNLIHSGGIDYVVTLPGIKKTEIKSFINIILNGKKTRELDNNKLDYVKFSPSIAKELGFTPVKGDPNLYMDEARKHHYGFHRIELEDDIVWSFKVLIADPKTKESVWIHLQFFDFVHHVQNIWYYLVLEELTFRHRTDQKMEIV